MRLVLIFTHAKEVVHGHPFYWHHSGTLSCKLVFREISRAGLGRRKKMELFYWIGGILAAGLLVYLLIALLKPEALS
jgi:K+-transporting ATPase KdpF subunit